MVCADGVATQTVGWVRQVIAYDQDATGTTPSAARAG